MISPYRSVLFLLYISQAFCLRLWTCVFVYYYPPPVKGRSVCCSPSISPPSNSQPARPANRLCCRPDHICFWNGNDLRSLNSLFLYYKSRVVVEEALYIHSTRTRSSSSSSAESLSRSPCPRRGGRSVMIFYCSGQKHQQQQHHHHFHYWLYLPSDRGHCRGSSSLCIKIMVSRSKWLIDANSLLCVASTMGACIHLCTADSSANKRQWAVFIKWWWWRPKWYLPPGVNTIIIYIISPMIEKERDGHRKP